MHSSYSFLNVEFQSILFSPPEIDDEKNTKSTQADIKAIVQQVGFLLNNKFRSKHINIHLFPKLERFSDTFLEIRLSLKNSTITTLIHVNTSVYLKPTPSTSTQQFQLMFI